MLQVRIRPPAARPPRPGALGAVHRATLAPGRSAAIVDPAFSTFRALCETLAVTADFDDFTVGPLVSLTSAMWGRTTASQQPMG